MPQAGPSGDVIQEKAGGGFLDQHSKTMIKLEAAHATGCAFGQLGGLRTVTGAPNRLHR